MQLRPLGKRVVLQHQEIEKENAFGIVLPDSAKEKTKEAIVISIGPEVDEGLNLKEGDKVIYSQYSGTDVKLEEEEYVIVSQDDIVAVVQ
ncbi:MAG: co-chaperone GroES [Clostridiales bacterium]|nr:co-chaperone GroES [Clostridiales bacterium]